MSDVFVSYSRKNSLFARRLINKLILAGKDAWVDWEGIPLTSPNWWSEIKAGIEGADNFVFILSPDSMASVVCSMELDYAIELNKRIVPVIYQDVETRDAFASIADFKPDEAMEERLEGKDPLIIARDNWQRLSHINWVFFRDEDDFDAAFETLVTTVETDLEYVKAHTRYLVRAQEWERENQRADLLLFGGEIDRAEAWLTKAENYVSVAKTSKDEKSSVVNPLPKDLHREYIRISRQADRRRRRLVLSAQLSIAVLAVVLIAGFLLGSSIIMQTQQQAADIEATSVQNVALAETQVADANSRLTAVPPTLTHVGQLVQEGGKRVESLRLAAEAVNILNDPAGNPEVAALLAICALNTAYSFQADAVLVKAVDSLYIRQQFSGHTGGVNSVAFSPDGRYALSGSLDNTLRLWEIETGAEVRVFSGHEDAVSSVAFSPDGRYALSGSLDNTLRLWEIETGAEVRVFSGHWGGVSSVAFSPDGRHALSGSGVLFRRPDNTLRLWEIETGAEVRVFLGHADGVNSVAFSPDGRYAVSGSLDNTLRLWNVATGEEVRVFSGHTDSVNSVTFSPDGRYALSGSGSILDILGSSDTTVRLWDVATGEDVRVFSGHTDGVTSVTFSLDGRYALSGSVDTTLRLWDVATGEDVHVFSGHTDGVDSVAFSSDGRYALSGSNDATLRLWPLTSSGD